MKRYYKNDLKRAYMILEGKENEANEYQLLMLKENEIPGILKTEVRYVDNQSLYYYDISGKTSFGTLYEKTKLSCEDMKRLVQDLLETIQQLRKFMLDDNCLLLEPEYIYWEKEHYYFCYYISEENNVREDFHTLMEFFVREVDYKDEEGVRIAYTLHKATMEENYSVEKIVEELFAEEEEETITEYEPILPDYAKRMANPTMEDQLLEEQNDIWSPLRRFFDRARRKQWGYEEEDL